MDNRSFLGFRCLGMDHLLGGFKMDLGGFQMDSQKIGKLIVGTFIIYPAFLTAKLIVIYEWATLFLWNY